VRPPRGQARETDEERHASSAGVCPVPATRATCHDASVSRTALLVDDHPGFRQEARQLLLAAGFDVVAEAAGAAEGLTVAARTNPDLILLDVGLPDGNGIELVPAFRGVAPRARVVLISSRRRAEYGDRIAASSADAFVDKVALGLSSPATAAELLLD